MATYRLRRMATIQAVQWTGRNCDEVFSFLGLRHEDHEPGDVEEVMFTRRRDSVSAFPGDLMSAFPGDWVIKDQDGVFDRLGSDNFERLYEPADDQPLIWEKLGGSA